MLPNRLRKTNTSSDFKRNHYARSSIYDLGSGFLTQNASSNGVDIASNQGLINKQLFSTVLRVDPKSLESHIISELAREIFNTSSLFSIMHKAKQDDHRSRFYKRSSIDNSISADNGNAEIQETLLNLQSWWGRIRKLRNKVGLVDMANICLSLPEDIDYFVSANKKTLNIDGEFIYLNKKSNFFLEEKLYAVLLSIIGSSGNLPSVSYTISINKKSIDIKGLSDKDKAEIMHVVYSYIYLYFADNVFRAFGKNINMPKWTIINTSN